MSNEVLAAALRAALEVLEGNGGDEPAKPTKKEAPAKSAPPPMKKTAAKRGAPKKAAITIEAVRDKLREVVTSVSKERAKELLAEFDVAKVTELPDTDYEEFMAACDEALAEEGGEEEADDDDL